jgi:hypothetical protein
METLPQLNQILSREVTDITLRLPIIEFVCRSEIPPKEYQQLMQLWYALQARGMSGWALKTHVDLSNEVCVFKLFNIKKEG